MSVNGIGNLPPGLIGGASLNRTTTPERGRGAAEPAPAGAPPSATRLQAARAGQDALPAEAPAGTDPELWKILTTDERQHFARAGARGPLTYGYLSRTQAAPTPSDAPVSRGVRLDLKA